MFKLLFASCFLLAFLGCGTHPRSQSDVKREDAPANTPSPTTPATAEKDLSNAAPELTAALDKVFGKYSAENGQLVDALKFLATAINRNPSKQYKLEFDIAPGVQGTFTGNYERKTLKEILDDMCRQTGCDWQVSGPTTVRITKLN